MKFIKLTTFALATLAATSSSQAQITLDAIDGNTSQSGNILDGSTVVGTYALGLTQTLSYTFDSASSQFLFEGAINSANDISIDLTFSAGYGLDSAVWAGNGDIGYNFGNGNPDFTAAWDVNGALTVDENATNGGQMNFTLAGVDIDTGAYAYTAGDVLRETTSNGVTFDDIYTFTSAADSQTMTYNTIGARIAAEAFTLNLNVVPEPSSTALLGLGGLALLARRRRA